MNAKLVTPELGSLDDDPVGDTVARATARIACTTTPF